jgi:hypothetical protein
MKAVQIVLDKKLLHAADQAARRTKQDRSALVRDALREHLRRFECAPVKSATAGVICDVRQPTPSFGVGNRRRRGGRIGRRSCHFDDSGRAIGSGSE